MQMKRCILLIILLFMGAMVAAPAGAQDTTTDLLTRINNLRLSLGLTPYTLNSSLSAAALNQARWMAQTGQISHTQDNGSTPRTRAQAAGYASSWVSENIYMGTNATAATAFTWWSNSPIHYRGMTNANYREIGIGWASGPAFNGSTAFVLVFGNPTGYTAPRRAASGGNSGSANAAPGLPPYVVGVDNSGYIMHEIQPGHTMGEIALIYGYTWDDLPDIREINDLTEEEARNNLEVGAILLIPPWEGTYTPTPGGPEPTREAATSAENEAVDSTLASVTEAAPVATTTPPPTATPPPTLPPAGVSTSAVVPEWVVQTTVAEDASRAGGTQSAQVSAPPVAETVVNPPTVERGSRWTAATVTPPPTGTGVVVAAAPPDADLLPEAAPVPESDDSNSIPPVLVAIIAGVVGVLVGFGVSMLRGPRT